MTPRRDQCLLSLGQGKEMHCGPGGNLGQYDRNMRCPECNTRLIMEALWQGRYVNCTTCGAKLQRSISGITWPVAAGILAWFLADWLLVMAGAPMEVEIPLGVTALGVAYLGVHVLTLELKPKEPDSLKLD